MGLLFESYCVRVMVMVIGVRVREVSCLTDRCARLLLLLEMWYCAQSRDCWPLVPAKFMVPLARSNGSGSFEIISSRELNLD